MKVLYAILCNYYYNFMIWCYRLRSTLVLSYQETRATDRQGCTQKKFVFVRVLHICSYVLKDFDLLPSSAGKILQTKDDLSYYFNISEAV